MKVESIYNPLVVAAQTWESLHDVAARMHFNDVGSAAIFDEGKLSGIITERDLTRAMAEHVDTDSTTVAEFMTAEPVVVEPDADAREAGEIMLNLGFRHLPVVTEGKVVGVVSIRDVLMDAAWDTR